MAESVADMLGKRIRRLREKKGLTQTELAKEVLSNKTAISEIETGHQVPKLVLVKRLEQALDADGALMDLYALLNLGVQESATVADAEHDAMTITDYETRNIPGLLQHPDYMEALMRAGRLPETRLETEMTIRLGRQKILSELITGWFILGEEVLHRPCGGKDVMRAQLVKLEEVAQLPNIFLQVLPFSVTDAPGYDGCLRVVEFRGDKPAIWFTEGIRSGRMSDDRAEVMQMLNTLNIIRSAALSVNESVQFIKAIRESKYE